MDLSFLSLSSLASLHETSFGNHSGTRMRFGTIASLCAATAFGAAQGATFDNLLSLVQQLQDEATALSTEYGAKDDEIALLMSQLTACEQEQGGGNDDAEEDNTPAPATISAPEVPAPRPTPAPTSAETPTETPTETPEEEEEDPEPSTPTSGDFTFALGQSWNYNLASPVDVDVDVDVFFIDMGELCMYVSSLSLCVSRQCRTSRAVVMRRCGTREQREERYNISRMTSIGEANGGFGCRLRMFFPFWN